MGRLADLKRKNPEMIIAAGGCVAQQEGRNILSRAPYVDVVFGTGAIGRLPRIIRQVETEGGRIVDVEMAPEMAEMDLPEPVQDDGSPARFVTIMRGCDNFCAYCVVPYVRGRECSRPPENIIREIETLVKTGVREVTLLGQNVNSYGFKENLCAFPDLLARVHAVEGLWRIRFTTSHPKDLSDELIGAFRELDKLCPHIHLPVQSGSDRILERMNRRYTRDMYLEKVRKLREACPDIALTSDMIVGFPGETRADFEATLDLIRSVVYDGLFAFIYSDRPGPPASRFPDKVPEPEARERLKELLDLQTVYTLQKNKELKGSIQPVLVDGLSRRPAADAPDPQWSGRTPGNKIVNFTQEADASFYHPNLMGKLVRVEIEEAFNHSLRGKALMIDPVDLKRKEYYAA
jgi:tRNA-2-methylthio-N6-dimethylallyladenosine synthase